MGRLDDIREKEFTYNSKFINDATYYGHLDIVKYFIEELKYNPTPYDVSTALLEGKFDIFYYFLNLGYDPEISHIFDHLQNKFHKSNTKCQSINQELWNAHFKTPINNNPEISIIMRLLLSLCQYKSYIIKKYDLERLIFAFEQQIPKCSILDFYFFIDNFSLEEISKNSIIRIYNLDIDFNKIQHISPKFRAPIPNSLIRDILKDNVLPLKNIISHIGMHGIELDDSLPCLQSDLFKEILGKIELTHELWYKWIHESISNKLSKHLEYLFGYKESYITELTERHKNMFFLNILNNLDNLVCECFLKQFPNIKCEWLDLIKIIGLDECKYIRKEIKKKYPNLIPHINFKFDFPKRKEKWLWWGLSDLYDGEGTYSTIEYKEITNINSKFSNIKTISNLKNNLDMLNTKISSPTDCYFEIDKEVFYHDSQDCLIWALEPKTGYVYIYEPNNIFTRIYVAKSLPEFLTHIDLENMEWYTKHNIEP